MIVIDNQKEDTITLYIAHHIRNIFAKNKVKWNLQCYQWMGDCHRSIKKYSLPSFRHGKKVMDG